MAGHYGKLLLEMLHLHITILPAFRGIENYRWYLGIVAAAGRIIYPQIEMHVNYYLILSRHNDARW